MLHFLTRNKKLLDYSVKIEELKAFASSSGMSVTIAESPVSYPVTTSTTADYDFEGGIADGKMFSLIEQAVLLRHGKFSQQMPTGANKNIDLSRLPYAGGIYFFGGILLNNFGHFLLESIGRLWAYDSFKQFNPSIFFYTPWGMPAYKKDDNYISQAFKALGIPIEKIIFFSEITTLQCLIIPEQKYGYGKCRTPDDIFIKFIKTFNIPTQPLNKEIAGEKIYVSRSRLPFSQGRAIGEKILEVYLQGNGYIIIYPEQLTLYQQLICYKQAKKIIFSDGGSTYCTVLLPELEAEIAIVARRRDSRWNYKEITEHFLGYKKANLWIDEVICQYQFGLETWDCLAEVDWKKVCLALKDAGFTTHFFDEKTIGDFEAIKKADLRDYIKSIQSNPLFINYMEGLREKYPLLPVSFEA